MKPPAFPFYVKDWLAGTRRLSLATRGAYIDLLAWSWDNGPVPPSVPEVAKILAVSVTETRPIWHRLRQRQFTRTPLGYINERLELEREKSKAFKELQAEKGRRSAAAKINRGSTAVEIRLEPEVNRPVGTGGQPALALALASALASADQDQVQDQKQRADARNSFAPLSKIAHDVLATIDAGTLDAQDVIEELKCRAAQAHIPYDAQVITKALSSATVQRRKGRT